MKFTYQKLSPLSVETKWFPVESSGIFYDGHNLTVLHDYLQGMVVAEVEADWIADADSQALKIMGLSKLPGDVVVTLSQPCASSA